MTSFHSKMKSVSSRTGVVPWRHHQFSALLCAMVLEWILMLLLLLEGLLSYLVTTFARLCKLQPPCPMCTRLDHVLGKAQPGFYRDLMCTSHKAEASAWAFCSVHQKLADVHSLCEACLLSFATDNKANLETCRSLMGKLGVGIRNSSYRNNFSLTYDVREATVRKKDTTLCSCCSRPLKLMSYPFVVLQNEDSGIGIEELGRGVSKFHQHVNGINYVAYSELKTSDSESEPWQLAGNAESLQKDVASDLKEGVILGHPQINNAKGVTLFDNLHEKVSGQHESILIHNGASYCKPSKNTGNMRSIETDGKVNLQSTDLPFNDGQQITEDSGTRVDKSENDVWHSAFDPTDELLVAATTSAETDTMEHEKKSEFTHTTSLKKSFNVHEDLKLLLSQLSNTPTSLAPEADTSTAQDQREQDILHNISRALPFQRNDSGLSEGTVSQLEVEPTTDQLKRQIELDRQSISRLRKELEEERNASAIAANQTMAMITRLQEEKAAMQMEAWQYQRMMEQQSEFDREDLRRMTETARTLEAEVESCKAKLRDRLFLAGEIRDDVGLSSCPEEEHEATVVSRATASLSGFEDEKASVSERLEKLKQKLHRFSNNSKDLPSSKLADDEEDSVDIDSVYEDDVEQGETDDLPLESNLLRNGSGFTDLTNGEYDRKVQQYHAMVSESDMASFAEEISEVRARLLALEADRSFLEHSVKSLRNGKEGKELVRDIARSLRELRKMGVAWKEYD